MCFRRSTHYQQTLCSEQWSLWKDPTTNVPMAVGVLALTADKLTARPR